MAGNDVVYITEEVSPADINTKLNSATIGVVNEDGTIFDDIGFASSNISWSNSLIYIQDNTHFIT